MCVFVCLWGRGGDATVGVGVDRPLSVRVPKDVLH